MTLSFLDLLLYASALWRLTNLLIYERGPYDAFLGLREMFHVEHDDGGNPIQYPDSHAARLLECPWCMSMFLSIPFAILIYLNADTARVFSFPFSLSALSIFIWKVILWLEHPSKPA